MAKKRTQRAKREHKEGGFREGNICADCQEPIDGAGYHWAEERVCEICNDERMRSAYPPDLDHMAVDEE